MMWGFTKRDFNGMLEIAGVYGYCWESSEGCVMAVCSLGFIAKRVSQQFCAEI
jgi:hypothetical protein